MELLEAGDSVCVWLLVRFGGGAGLSQCDLRPLVFRVSRARYVLWRRANPWWLGVSADAGSTGAMAISGSDPRTRGLVKVRDGGMTSSLEVLRLFVV